MAFGEVADSSLNLLQNGHELHVAPEVEKIHIAATVVEIAPMDFTGTEAEDLEEQQVLLADSFGLKGGVTADVILDTGYHNLQAGENVIEVRARSSVSDKEFTYTIIVHRGSTEPTSAQRAASHSLKLYPNPITTGELTIENEKWNSPSHVIARSEERATWQSQTISIYSVSGALVATYPATDEVTIINVSHLPGGTYLLKMGRYTGKFVKR